MPGPMPTANIAISDINAQLGNYVGSGGGVNSSLRDLYDFASTSSGLGSAGIAGNYHNLAMGVGTQYNFATQIWTVWNSGVYYDLPVGNWGNYYNDHNVVLDWDISMDPGFKPNEVVGIDLYLSDTNNGSGTNTFVATISLSPAQSSHELDFNTGIPAYTSFGTNLGYWIYADISMTAGSASDSYVKIPSGTFGDTDGVGPDISRSRRTSGMPYNIGTNGNPFSGVLFGGSAIGAPIAWNKRTYFALEITP